MSNPSQPHQPGEYGYPQQPHQPQPAQGYHHPAYGVTPSPTPPKPQERRGVPVLAVIGIAVGTFLFGCLGGLAVANISPDDEDTVASESTPSIADSPTPAATQDRESEPSAPPSPEPEPAEPQALTVPDNLVGQNAAIVEERLEDMGFTNIQFASADRDDTVVLLPANWTIVEVEPAAGTEVDPDSLIVLTCSKQE